MTQPQPRSKKGMGCAVAFGALVVILLFGIIGAANSGSSGTQGTGTDTATTVQTAPTTEQATQAPDTPQPTPPPTPPPTPSGPATSIGEGTYVVGTDIVAGTYHTTGPSGDNPVGCYWEREKDTSGNFASIITNDISKGPATVTIGKSDGAFKTSSCQTWHKIG